MKHARLLAAVAVLTVAAATLTLWLSPRAPETAPDISVVTTEGAQLAFSSLRGRPVLVTFWATTCKSCVREIPDLVDLYRELAPRGLEIVAIAMSYDPPNRVLEMRAARDIPYPVGLDLHADAARAFGKVRLTPTAFLIAPDGRIVFRKTGALSFPQLRQDILALLGDHAALDSGHSG